MIYLWRGHHAHKLRGELEHSLSREHLFILCPPHLRDFQFISFLPEDEITLLGSFLENEREHIVHLSRSKRRSAMRYPEPPVIGVFTSGTLSLRPRLVLYSKKNIVAALEGILSFFDQGAIKNVFCYPPPFHTFGLVLGYLQCIFYNRQLLIGEGRYSARTHAARLDASEYETLTLGTPAHFYDLAQYAKERGVSPTPTYSCIMGGAKVSVALWQRVRGELNIAQPSIGYGATEACPGIMHLPPGHEPKEEGEIGFVIPGVSITSMSEEGLEFSGPSACLALIDGEELTFPRTIRIPDLIEQRKTDQVFVFRGRLGLVLNRGGTKYSLEHLEQIFKSELGLSTCCVNVDDERLVEDLAMLVEWPNNCGTEELRGRCAETLKRTYGHSFALQRLKPVAQLPLTENGKIDRRLARELLLTPN